MKYIGHVPTEQYGFISVEFEGTASEAVEAYKELQQAWKGGTGLSPIKWNAWLDGYLEGNPGSVEEWAEMDEFQKKVINELKKAKKRNQK